MEQFAKTGDFCPNETCPDYGKLQDGQRQQNIIKSAKIVSSLNPFTRDKLLIRLPSASKANVSRISCSGVRLRKKSVPVVSVKVFLHVLH